LTGREIVMRLAMTVEPLLLPIALTQTPVVRSERLTATCSETTVAEPTVIFDFPVGLSEVVNVNVLPERETIGPETDPLTGAAAPAAAVRARATQAATPTTYTLRAAVEVMSLLCLSRRRNT